MRRRLLLAGLLVLAAPPIGAEPPILLRVTPKIALAPANVEIRATFTRHPDNRKISIIAESQDYYRRSEIDLEGSATPQTYVIQYRDLPEGQYQIVAVLETADGQTVRAAGELRVNP
jgi:hypothetical protein